MAHVSHKNWSGRGRRPSSTYRGARMNIIKIEERKVNRFVRKERWASYKLWEGKRGVA